MDCLFKRKTFSNLSQGREDAAWLASLSFSSYFQCNQRENCSQSCSICRCWMALCPFLVLPRFLLASSGGLSAGLGFEHGKLEPAELALKGKLVVKYHEQIS